MAIYLHDIPFQEARSHFQQALETVGLWRILDVEEIPLDEHACGRILAEPLFALISSPHYHASAMDGFAVKATDTVGAMSTNPITLNCNPIQPQALYLDTGDPIPGWADAVIPIENTEAVDISGQVASDPRHPAFIRIRAAVTPWSHIRPLGEDIIATQLLLPAGCQLRPVDLGAAAACGHTRLRVSRKPKIAILPTGSELVQIGKPVESGDIIEFNSVMLAAQVSNWGGSATRWSILRDDLESIKTQTLKAAQTHDLVIINAGSSAGAEDFTAQVVQNLGRLLVHGVAVRPGHPVILGMLDLQDRSVPIIGVPGYPVSAALTGEIFIEPLIATWLGRKSEEKIKMPATLTRKVTSPPGDDDFLRVAVGQVGEQMLAAPLSRGAGVITSLARADGLIHVPRGIQGLSAGAPVTVHLYRSPMEIDRTILIIGSHDLTIDILAQYITKHDRRLASVNVGSLGGLVALRRGEAHLAGSHLLDPTTGVYNLTYLPQYLPNEPAIILGFVYRQQGLLVLPGNPKGIHGLGDLTREDITFVNRQRGAGTRVLLDYQLDQEGIAVEFVRGYNQEEYTHLGVAAAIASGRADCGLGIAAAAQALQLDFIPLTQERYDLIIPSRHFESAHLKPLLDLLHNDGFRNAAASMPGYEVSLMGSVIAEYSPQAI
jgi:putative molybdopterin biosynthesis protein